MAMNNNTHPIWFTDLQLEILSQFHGCNTFDPNDFPASKEKTALRALTQRGFLRVLTGDGYITVTPKGMFAAGLAYEHLKEGLG